MKTYSYGDYTVPASSIKEGQLIIDHLIDLDKRKKEELILKQRKHAHNFGDNRKCNCGVYEKDYHFQQLEEKCYHAEI